MSNKKLKGTAFVFGEQAEAEDVSLNSFFDWILEENSKSKNWPYGYSVPVEKIGTIASIKKYHNNIIGIICSNKGNKFFHSKKLENEVLTIKPSNMGEDAIEINFFCISLTNFKGIYSYYVGSHPVNDFLDELWKSYKNYVLQKKENFSSELEKDDNLSDKEKKEKLNRYSLIKKKSYSILLTPDEYKKLIKNFSRIEEIRVTTPDIDSEDDEPISKNLKYCNKKYSFINLIPDDGFLGWISKVYEKCRFLTKNGEEKHNGRITGYDKDNKKIYFDFSRNTKDYLDFDYDNIGEINTTKLEEHGIIKKMIEVMEQDVIFR